MMRSHKFTIAGNASNLKKRAVQKGMLLPNFFAPLLDIEQTPSLTSQRLLVVLERRQSSEAVSGFANNLGYSSSTRHDLLSFCLSLADGHIHRGELIRLGGGIARLVSLESQRERNQCFGVELRGRGFLPQMYRRDAEWNHGCGNAFVFSR